MSSHAAAAISAMITSQVYPQLHLPTSSKKPRSQSEELEQVRIFAKGTNQAIGSFQVIIGIGIILATYWISFDERRIPSVVTSLTGCVLYITSGIFPCGSCKCIERVKRRLIVIRAIIITNTLSAVTALISIIIYICEMVCFGYPYCSDVQHSALGIVLSLSLLELVFAVLTIVYGCKALHHINDLEPVVYSHEGWRDGARGSDDGKDMMVTSTVSL